MGVWLLSETDLDANLPPMHPSWFASLNILDLSKMPSTFYFRPLSIATNGRALGIRGYLNNGQDLLIKTRQWFFPTEDRQILWDLYPVLYTGIEYTDDPYTPPSIPPTGNVTNVLKYIPGVVVNSATYNNTTLDNWKGQVYTGYQSLYEYFTMGLSDRIENVLSFLQDSQNDYQSRTGLLGPFTTVFHPNNWESYNFSIAGDTFNFIGTDPKSTWSGYNFQMLFQLAKYLYYNPRDIKAKNILIRFLNFLDRDYLTNNTNQPITDFIASGSPQRNYHDPYAASLIMKAGIYANMAGCDPALSFRLVKKNWEYIKTQYVSSGNMNGSFSAGQSIFQTSFRNYYSYWHFEIVDSLAMLYRYRDQLTIPSCDQIF